MAESLQELACRAAERHLAMACKEDGDACGDAEHGGGERGSRRRACPRLRPDDDRFAFAPGELALRNIPEWAIERAYAAVINVLLPSDVDLVDKMFDFLHMKNGRIEGFISPRDLRPFYLSAAIKRVALFKWKRLDDIERINGTHFPALAHLVLGPAHKSKNVTMHPRHLSSALKSISSLSTLQTLCVSGHALQMILKNAHDAIGSLPLRALVLEGSGENALTGEKAEALGRALPPTLEVLKLSSMGIDGPLFAAIVGCSRTKNSRIRTLSVSGNPLDELSFLDAERLFGAVVNLDLRWTNCTDELPLFLKFMNRLKCLDVSRTKCTRQVFETFRTLGKTFEKFIMTDHFLLNLPPPASSSLVYGTYRDSTLYDGDGNDDENIFFKRLHYAPHAKFMPALEPLHGKESTEDRSVQAWYDRITSANLSEYERAVDSSVTEVSKQKPRKAQTLLNQNGKLPPPPSCNCVLCIRRYDGGAKPAMKKITYSVSKLKAMRGAKKVTYSIETLVGLRPERIQKNAPST